MFSASRNIHVEVLGSPWPQHWGGLVLEVLASGLSSLLSFWLFPESSNGTRIIESLMLEKDL